MSRYTMTRGLYSAEWHEGRGRWHIRKGGQFVAAAYSRVEANRKLRQLCPETVAEALAAADSGEFMRIKMAAEAEADAADAADLAESWAVDPAEAEAREAERKAAVIARKAAAHGLPVEAGQAAVNPTIGKALTARRAAEAAVPVRCEACSRDPEDRTCADCGLTVTVVDCGHSSQSVEIAVSMIGPGADDWTCEACEAVRQATESVS